jgi:hypothetical protein
MIRHPSYRRLGCPQNQPVGVWKIPPPMGFDPRTVQYKVKANVLFLKIWLIFRYTLSVTPYTRPYQHVHCAYRQYSRNLRSVTTNKGAINTFIFAIKYIYSCVEAF